MKHFSPKRRSPVAFISSPQEYQMITFTWFFYSFSTTNNSFNLFFNRDSMLIWHIQSVFLVFGIFGTQREILASTKGKIPPASFSNLLKQNKQLFVWSKISRKAQIHCLYGAWFDPAHYQVNPQMMSWVRLAGGFAIHQWKPCDSRSVLKYLCFVILLISQQKSRVNAHH